MICYPEEGSSITRKLAIAVRLEIGHDLNCLVGVGIRPRERAVGDAESKYNLPFKEKITN
jgi:hypothetical protein